MASFLSLAEPAPNVREAVPRHTAAGGAEAREIVLRGLAPLLRAPVSRVIW